MTTTEVPVAAIRTAQPPTAQPPTAHAPTTQPPTAQPPAGAPRRVSPVATATASADNAGLPLDMPIRVIPIRAWAALVALLLVIAATVLWGIAGSLPQQVSLPGVIFHGPGPVNAQASRAGVVHAIAVRPGQHVRAGQKVAELSTAAGAVSVTAPITGPVLTVTAATGDQVQAGTALLSIAAEQTPPSAELAVTSATDLGRLAAGQPVLLIAGSDALTGRISGIDAVPTSAAAFEARFAVPLDGLPTGENSVWIVHVALDPGQRAPTLSAASATVELPAIAPYQLVFGGQ